MIKIKLSLLFSLFLVLIGVQTACAQSTPTSSVGIALSEYCVSNIGLTGTPQTDYYGNKSDWVEIHSTFPASVSLSGYYLSNDPNNLYKWPFPSNFILAPNQYKILWLSGKNVVAPNGECHTNFKIDQCKGQWLILTSSQGGTVRDSVFVQKTKEGHSRGRVDFTIRGIKGWKIFTTSTCGFANSGPTYVDYAPRPIIKTVEDSMSVYNGVNTGSFSPSSTNELLYIYLEDRVRYDTNSTCFRVYYTLDNGNYPVPGAIGTTQLLDGSSILTTNPCTLIRAISVPVSSGDPINPSGCEIDYLPSFCETNTYFTHENYDQFSPEFGVISIAVDEADTSWFNSNGASKPLVHVEYYDKKQQMVEGYTQLSRPVNEAWLTRQKGFNMTIDDRRGFGCNFEGDIFNVDKLGTTDRKVFPTLHLKAGDYESHSPSLGGLPSPGTGVLDVFYQSLAVKNNLHVNPLHIKPVIAFLNGKYQGVYDLREVYDKYYEQYYNHQSPDSVDILYFHGIDGAITYYDDGLPSAVSTGANSFANSVYTLGISPIINNVANYNKLFSKLDKENFIDYMILNSYAMNSNLWQYNIAYAKGGQVSQPGSKWHYYMWNTPAIFNFTAVSLAGASYFPNTTVSPCLIHTNSNTVNVTPPAGNGHGRILSNLMDGTPVTPTSGRGLFQQEYKNRYQDLLNGPLKCENILRHFDSIKSLYLKEMSYMEDPASIPVAGPYIQLGGSPAEWDTNMVIIRRGLAKRCNAMGSAFGTQFGANCYGMRGPYPLTVDVQPAGAGKVQLNSLLLDNYIWSGGYYATTLTFKAIPANDTYVFHHWEFKNHTPLNSAPLSFDSVAISFAQPGDDVIAIFTDKKNDIVMPSGFTPNGDGINDLFQPLGSALYSTEFDFSVWNRWGQEVFRSTDPTRGWDGSFKGQQVQTGVYAYVITYKNIYNESKILKGNLTLLR